MPAHTIRIIGDPDLYRQTTHVDEITDEVNSVINDVIDTMKAANGAGLAATQIGSTLKVVAVDCTSVQSGNPAPRNEDDNILVLINPKLTLGPHRIRWREACLSIPGVSGMVERSDHVTVEFMDAGGEQRTIDVGWPLAGAIQHECDHLDGILYPDRMGQVSKRMIMKKIKKIKERVEKAYRAKMSIPNRSKKKPRLSSKVRESRRSQAKAARVSRRASRSR